MLKIICVISLLLLQGCAVRAALVEPTVHVEVLAYHPSYLDESSGLVKAAQRFWTLNDSGGQAVIFGLSRSAWTVESQVVIRQATAVDWETLTANDTHLFIGDCGNNRGMRSDLTIYKIPIKHLNKPAVVAQQLRFRFANQRDFSKRKLHDFDCEALTAVGNALWLFSKNRLSQTSDLYVLAPDIQDQQLTKTMNLPVGGLITGADYHPATGVIALLGYSKASIWGYSFIWLVPTSMTSHKLLWEHAQRIIVQPYGQWEGIAWESPRTLLITSVRSALGANQIGRVTLPDSFVVTAKD